MCVVAQCGAAGWLVSMVLGRQLQSRIRTQCQTAASAGAKKPNLSHYSSLATDLVSLRTMPKVLAAKAG